MATKTEYCSPQNAETTSTATRNIRATVVGFTGATCRQTMTTTATIVRHATHRQTCFDALFFTGVFYPALDNSEALDDNGAVTKTPEQWLEEAAPEKKEGVFKLFLGYAPGVGKTFGMLSEAIRRYSRGEDVVIGVVENHGRKPIVDLAGRLDVIPRKKLEYKGTVFEEMDVDAILQRKPTVVLVDELAHTNIEGSKHAKRYQDVIELLEAKIDVVSTMNVQHIESLTPLVEKITGVRVRETVPDWVIQRAGEIVMADLTPQALQTRMRRGDIYPLERAERALANFFRNTNLVALRELALRQVTQAVDRTLSELNTEDGRPLQVCEKIAVCISSNPAAQYLIARGARMAQAMNGDLFVLYVD